VAAGKRTKQTRIYLKEQQNHWVGKGGRFKGTRLSKETEEEKKKKHVKSQKPWGKTKNDTKKEITYLGEINRGWGLEEKRRNKKTFSKI